MLENELQYGVSYPVSQESMSPDFVLPIGKAKVIREGKDVTVVSHSRTLNFCIEAAEKLQAEEGISVEVINLRSIKPLDVDLITNSVKKTNHLVSVETGYPMFSVSSEICALAMETEMFDYLDAPVERLTGAGKKKKGKKSLNIYFYYYLYIILLILIIIIIYHCYIVTRIDIPTPYTANLENLSVPDTQVIIKVIKRSLYRKK